GHRYRRIGVAVLQQNAKFIASQSRQQAGGTEIFLQQRGSLLQQLVPRGMATCVVDDLELVEIEKHQRMLARLMRQSVERSSKAGFEFATVDEPRQGVVRCLPRQLRH